MAALLLLNIVAPVTFAFRARSYGWWTQAGTQTIDLIFCVLVVSQAPDFDRSLSALWPYVVPGACSFVSIGLLTLWKYGGF